MTQIPIEGRPEAARAGKAPIVDVVVVAHNCGRALSETLDVLPYRELRSVVVVDRESTDHTGQVARDSGAVVLRARGGYGAACQRALHHLESLPTQPDVVVFVDPTGPEDPAELSKLIAPFRFEKAEFVLATTGKSQWRQRALRGLIGAIYGHNFQGLSSFRALRYPALVALGVRAKAEGWDVEMLVKAVRLGLHIVEIPVRSKSNRGAKLSNIATGRQVLRILRHATAR